MAKDNFKIALVGPLPPPAGGMANQAQLLLQYLQADKHQVYFVRTNADYKPVWIKNIKVIRSLFRLFFYFIDLWQVAGQVRLFHVLSNSGWSWFLFSVPVLIIGRLRKVPVIINYRGGEADAFFSRTWRWVKPTLNMARLITVPTAYLESVFYKWEIQTQIVPNIIDLSVFSAKNKSIHKSDTFNKDTLHFIVTRNLEKIYGNDIIINAFALIIKHYPNAQLTIAGSGPEEETLKQQVAELSLQNHVRFSGKLNRLEMAELYQKADIMLNASRVDNTPNSIIEALASGVIVISSCSGGIPWLVKDKETALLMQQNTAEQMFNCVKELLEKNMANKLRENGYLLAEQFSWNNVRNKLYSTYKIAMS